MTVKVYVDQAFLVNGGMDLLLLLLAARILGRRPGKGRLVLGAAAGAGIGTAGLLAGLSWGFWEFWRAAGLAAGSLAMGRIAFGKTSLKNLLRIGAALFLAAILMGGVLSAALTFLPARPLSLAGLGFLAAGAFFAARAAASFLEENRRRRQRLFSARLTWQGRESRVTALWDTGNRLYEPVTRRPVHVLDGAVARELAETVPAVFYVPYRTVGRSQGLLPAIVLEELEVEREGERILMKRPLVALSSRPVSPDNEYQLLLHESFPDGGVTEADHHHKEEST